MSELLEGSNPTNAGMIMPPEHESNDAAPAFDSGEAAAGIAPSTIEKIGAVLGLASDKAPLGIPGFSEDSPGALLRAHAEALANEKAQTENVGKISRDEANKRFPGMPTPFNEPVNPFVAELQYNAQKHREKMQDWASRGGGLPWGVPTAIGIAGGVFDPVNLMAMFLTSGASNALGITRNVLTTFGENLAINSATGAISYKQERAEHQDVTPFDAGLQAVGGAVGGTALHYAFGAVSKALGGAVDAIRKTPKDIQDQNLKTALAQHESGAKVDVTPGNIEAASRLRGDMAGENSPYKFTPMQHPSERPLFAARNIKGEPVEYANLGPGIQAVDDGMVANNRVSVEGGRVDQIQVAQDAKVLDLEQSASSVADEKLIKQIEEKTGVKLDIQPEESIKDVLSRLGGMAERGDAPHDILAQVQDIAKSEGYHGYQYTLGDEQSGSQKNGVHLFDDTRASVAGTFDANPDITPRRSGAEIDSTNQQMNSLSASQYHTPETDQAIHDFKHEKPLNAQPDYMDDQYKETYDSARAKLDELAKENPALAKELHDILDRENATDKQEQNVAQELADCLGGS